MADWPEVTILICTYNRPTEITKTMQALVDRVKYPLGKVSWIIADDCSPNGYVAKLQSFDTFNLQEKVNFVVTPTNLGWGANVNNGLRAVKTPYVFFIEDDYVLGHDLDLKIGIALMETKRDIGMVRYRGIAGEHMVLHQFEALIEGWLPHYQDGYGLPGRLTHFQLDSGSPSLYLYSHGPHLKRHPAFHDFYGLYPEGLKLGETEERYAHTVRDRMKTEGAPAIDILPDWVPMRFDHIGKSYQEAGL